MRGAVARRAATIRRAVPALALAWALVPARAVAQTENVSVEPLGRPKMDAGVVALSYSSRGDSVAVALANGKVRLLDASGSAGGRDLLGGGARLTALARSRDDARLAAGNERGDVQVVDLATGAVRSARIGEPVTSLAFSPSGNVVAAGARDGHVALIAAASGDVMGRMRAGHRKAVVHVAYLRDGETVVSVGEDRDIVYWDVKRMERLRQLQEPEPLIMSATGTPSGDLLFVGTEEFQRPGMGQSQPTYRDGVRVYDVSTGAPQKSFDLMGQAPIAMAGAPDCRHVGIAMRDRRGSTLGIFDVERGTRVYDTPTPGKAQAIAFSPDGRGIAVGADDGTVQMMAVRGVLPRPRCVADLKGTKFALTGLRTPLVRASRRLRFAVLDLDDNGVGPDVARAIADQLSTRLGLNPGVRLVERRRIAAIMKEQNFQQTGRTDAQGAVQLARIFNVQKVLMGAVAKLGTTMTITVQMVDVETAAIDGSREVQCRACALEDLTEAMSELAQTVVSEPDQSVLNYPEPPGLRLDYPRDNVEVRTNSIVVRGAVEYSRPLEGLELIVNGRAVDASRLVDVRAGKLTRLGGDVQTFAFVQEVTLTEPVNVIAVRALGADGNDEQRIVTVRWSGTATPAGVAATPGGPPAGPGGAVAVAPAPTPPGVAPTPPQPGAVPAGGGAKVTTMSKTIAPGIGLAELESALRSKVAPARLTTIVGKFGVDFASTSDTDARLRAAGATDAVVQAVRAARKAPAAAEIP
ncbi:MAG: hypothetical protein HYX65_09450 [Gemmatimonadetes bacterium]|nr:hypothetical protein [Gemmatimonadota bacterium]